MAKTWVLTGSLENFRATREHGFRVIGAKEGRRGMAEQIEPGDRIVFYITELQAFAGIVEVTGEMYEDRAKMWPGKPGKPDPYPWRFETRPEVVLDEDEFVPAVELAGELEHVRKWPAAALAARLPGPAAHGAGGGRGAARAAPPRERPRGGVSRASAMHSRHYTLEQATAAPAEGQGADRAHAHAPASA